MRIALRLADRALARALADLLADAGHRVDVEGRDDARADLLIESATPAPSQPAVAAHAVLRLRPTAKDRVADDPAAALARALREGGTVVWAPPLDAMLLVDVLAGAATDRPRAARAPRLSVVSLDSAPDAWIRLDPATHEVLWCSHAARSRLLVEGSRLAPRLAESVEARLAGAVDGRARVEVDGRPHFLVWWTEHAHGLHVGLFRLSSADMRSEANVRSLAELGRVSATLAHEIRNPLAALAGAVDLLADEADPLERAEVVVLAQQRVEQMRTLLDDALRLSRPFRGLPEPVEPADVVESAVSAVRTDPLFRAIDLRVELDADAPTALGYPEPLRQAFLNVLLNAAQAQEGRGAIRVITRVDADRVTLCVQDAGPGIAPELREKVFEPFWTTKKTGTGLGLPFARRVAEAAGGRAFVMDVPRGACVCLEMPLARSGKADGSAAT